MRINAKAQKVRDLLGLNTSPDEGGWKAPALQIPLTVVPALIVLVLTSAADLPALWSWGLCLLTAVVTGVATFAYAMKRCDPEQPE